MRYLLTFLLTLTIWSGAVAQDGVPIIAYKFYDSTRVEDYQKIKRKRPTVVVDSAWIVLRLWGDECFFKLKFRNRSDNLTGVQTGMRNGHPFIKFSNKNYGYRAFVNKSGNFELDAIMKTKSANGRHSFRFPIETKGLTFHYQDTLSDEAKAMGDVRPDSIIGSYYVKHSTKGAFDNVIRSDGTVDEYKNGWAFSMFRPKVWDASGNTVWGWQKINIVEGWYEIGVDSTWRANADDPVTFDPILGSSFETGTASGNNADQKFSNGPHTMSENGTATSITIWSINANGEPFRMGIYEDSSGFPRALLRLTNDGNAGADGFQTQTLTSDFSLVNGTSYHVVAFWESASGHIYNTVSGVDRSVFAGPTYNPANMPDPFLVSATTTPDREYSWYITYTADVPVGGWQGQVIPVTIQ